MHTNMADNHYDIAVIGGGVVGCAVLFELTQQGYSCILVERNQNIMSEASAGNSGMLHTGFDAPLFSLEQHCIKECQKGIHNLIDKFNIPHRKCGSILLAWTEKQNGEIPDLCHTAHKAGISDVEILSLSELYKMEPYLRTGAHGALFVPGEAVIDSNLLGLCIAHHAKLQGAKILTNCEVIGFNDKNLTTTHGPIKAEVTINCSGLCGDLVDRLAGIETFSVKPRKGQYCVYGKNTSNFLNSIIMPVPTETTKGIAVFRSVYDNVIVGPTAENVQQRTRPVCDPKVHTSLSNYGCSVLPQLVKSTPIGQYVGVRPATQFKSYQIRSYPQLGWITVGGIRSTGVSASLGIAKYVSEKLRSHMGPEQHRGSTKHIEELHWTMGSDKASVVMNGCQYHTAHPIFVYGNQAIGSRL